MQQVEGQPGAGHPGIPHGGVQLFMMQPGAGSPGQMPQGMAGAPIPGRMAGGSSGGGQQGMMHSPGAMATGPDPGKGQAGSMEPEGKGSRVVGLSRKSQPKQGASWHGGDRRAGRPSSDFASGGSSRPYGDLSNEMMQQQQMADAGLGSMQVGISGSSVFPTQAPAKAGMGGHGHAMALESSSASDSKLRGKNLRNPKNPWADVVDTAQGAYDQDMQGLWPLRHQAGMDRSPPKHPPQQHPSGSGRGGKAGRKDGKNSDDANAQKWVEVGRASEQ